MRYGLTTQQMRELKEAGQWKRFKALWQEKRVRYFRREGLSCYLCDSNRRGGINVIDKYICRECCKAIRDVVIR